jgi:radical SAM protein with 4Fe4S-binding SPASM domain
MGDSFVAYNCSNQLISIWSDGAGQVWKALVSGSPIDEMMPVFCREWGVSSQEATQLVQAFLEEITEDGYLIRDGSSNNNEPTLPSGTDVLMTIEMMAIETLTPFAVTFETTYACNEHCIHCYMDRGKPSLSTEEIIRILDELAEAGTVFVSFTGGEFFTRKDALRIVDEAHKRHFVIDILSNGTMITPEIADYLSKRTVRRVQVSLYGACAATHDHVTRLPGSFSKTLEGVRHLTDKGVKVEIAYPMMSINYAERHLLCELVESLGCIISPSPIITARNDGSEDTFDLRISDEQFTEFYADRELSSLYAGRKAFYEHQLYFGFSDILGAPPCYSGFNCCAITPEGKVYPCNQMLYEVGDLRVTSFSEIWENSQELAIIRSLKVGDLTTCTSCELLSSCARCPGLAILEGGDLLGPSPENCRQARILRDRREVPG